MFYAYTIEYRDKEEPWEIAILLLSPPGKAVRDWLDATKGFTEAEEYRIKRIKEIERYAIYLTAFEVMAHPDFAKGASEVTFTDGKASWKKQ